MQRKRAFTLIELLVVIAIIAILAAILFPVFAKARERAKQSKSLNNIKQLALAVMQYSQDYQETFPGWMNNAITGNPVYAHNCWDEQINGQVKSTGVFTNGDTGIASPSQPTPRDRVLTYGMNALLTTPATATGDASYAAVTAASGPSPLSPSAISNPAGTILFAELATTGPVSAGAGFAVGTAPASRTTGVGNAASDSWKNALGGNANGGPIDISPKAWVESGGNGLITNYNDPYTTLATNFGVARDLYGGGGVYAFCDGHVQFLKIGKSVGMGLTNLSGAVVSTSALAWAGTNQNNMWVPQ